MNERITENIVRDLLREKSYYEESNGLLIEEQKSKNPRIQKCLKTASKSGNGVGKPEFIISSTNDQDFLIVIECKADTAKHESKTRDEFKGYAVDGVMLYASYLSKEFDVLAIAVSGQDKQELKISHFLQKKNAYTPKEIIKTPFLSWDDYLLLFQKETKLLRDEDLIEKAIELNNLLHSYDVPEVERCSLISFILVALQDEPFKLSYLAHGDNVALMTGMLSACKNVLAKNGIKDERQEIILAEYKKIQNNKILTGETIKKKKRQGEPNTLLKEELIQELQNSVLPSVIEADFDILGRFYREFIRYAGSDSKTGLVLTPFHITDFFCDLVNLQPADIVYDPCCGTGGFLVSAMARMIKESGNNPAEHKKIKSERILGVEKRADMFAHACSNMMMRGDGKAGIYFDDCFKIAEEIKEKNPTVSFLNPPYSVGVTGQLEFVEHSLEVLQTGGRCVSICQMSVAIGNNKDLVKVRERLLANHTLEAVLSVPNELFYPVGVVTCILVFKAHQKHPENYETFFGYYKDDGFVKRKNKGRIDAKDAWGKTKEKWINSYMNGTVEAGFSVKRCVTAGDEWCSEAYMETDYSKLTEADFTKTIKEFVAFQFMQGGTNEAGKS